MDSPSPSKPLVVALGSGAGRVVNRMVRDGTVDADFIALNTDAQDLKRALAPRSCCSAPRGRAGWAQRGTRRAVGRG